MKQTIDIEAIRKRYSDNGLTPDEYRQLRTSEIAKMRLDCKRLLDALEGKQSYIEQLEQAEAAKIELYKSTIAEREAAIARAEEAERKYNKLNDFDNTQAKRILNRVSELEYELAHLHKERDAAVEDIPRSCRTCLFHDEQGCIRNFECGSLIECGNWQWRGVRE